MAEDDEGAEDAAPMRWALSFFKLSVEDVPAEEAGVWTDFG